MADDDDNMERHSQAFLSFPYSRHSMHQPHRVFVRVCQLHAFPAIACQEREDVISPFSFLRLLQMLCKTMFHVNK
jgi:hypothetical protein